jgi:hypothetical protein
MKKVTNSAKGKLAKASGDALEAEIGLICEAYEKQGRAKIHKVDPPTRMVRQGRKVIAIPLKSPFVDWLGCWTENGKRMVHLESKNTGEPRLPILRDDGLKVSQYDNMVRWHRAGVITGVLWGHRGQMKLISLPTIAAAIAAGHVSLKWRHHRLCSRGQGLITWDFLTELRDC